MGAVDEQPALIVAPTLHLVIRGAPISGNAKTRSRAMAMKDPYTKAALLDKYGKPRYRAMTFTTPEARAWEENVVGQILYAVVTAEWEAPKWCSVDFIIWNVAQDRTNVLKTIEDCLQMGNALQNDRWIIDGRTTKRKDDNGPRVEVYVRAVDPRWYGY